MSSCRPPGRSASRAASADGRAGQPSGLTGATKRLSRKQLWLAHRLPLAGAEGGVLLPLLSELPYLLALAWFAVWLVAGLLALISALLRMGLSLIRPSGIPSRRRIEGLLAFVVIWSIVILSGMNVVLSFAKAPSLFTGVLLVCIALIGIGTLRSLR